MIIETKKKGKKYVCLVKQDFKKRDNCEFLRVMFVSI